MRSTLYLKFVIIYIAFGFVSLFTVATLTSSLVKNTLKDETASAMYAEATEIANSYLPGYFSESLNTRSVQLQLSGI